MNDTAAVIPGWWLGISAFFFFLVSVLFIVLCGLVWKLINTVSNLEPKVSGLMTTVNDSVMPKVASLTATVNDNIVPKVSGLIDTVNDGLVPQVQGLVTRVEGLTGKVEGIADSAKGTVDSLGDRAKGVASSLEGVANKATDKFQAAAPIVGIAVAGLRLYSLFVESRGTQPGKVKIEKKKDAVTVELDTQTVDGQPSDGGNMLASRGVEQSGSSSGS